MTRTIGANGGILERAWAKSIASWETWVSYTLSYQEEEMAVAYSKEFRREVLAACDSGKGTREVAVAFKVSESWVRRIKQERRELGKTAPKQTRNRQPKWWPYKDHIIEIVDSRPDITLAELKTELETNLSRSTLCQALKQLKLTFKKSLSGGRATAA